MDLKRGYKRTEVGVIPEDWGLEAVEDIVDPNAPVCYGVVQVGANTDNGVPIIAIKFVKEIAHAPLHRTAVNLERPYTRSRVRSGDVLISIKGTIGRVGVVPEGFRGNISRELAKLRLRNGFVPAYVASQLESRQTQERITHAVVGTTRLEFSIASLRKFKIPVPPSGGEQTAIATALADVEALLVGLDRLIAKKRGVKEAAMHQLLSGEVRLPGFGPAKKSRRQSEIGILPTDWRIGQVGQLAVITTGARNTQDRIEDGPYPFFVRSDSVERIDSYSFDGEAILTAGDGVGTGKVFHYINGKFDVHQRVYRISNFRDSLNGRFFYFVFSARFFRRIMSMTAKSSVDSVRMDMISEMLIPLPGADEQAAIAAILSDMDAEVIAVEKWRDKTCALKHAMMQELLTGKTRLVTPEVAHV